MGSIPICVTLKFFRVKPHTDDHPKKPAIFVPIASVHGKCLRYTEDADRSFLRRKTLRC